MEANPNQQVLALKSLEAFAKSRRQEGDQDHYSSDLQGFAGLAASAKELFSDDAVKKS